MLVEYIRLFVYMIDSLYILFTKQTYVSEIDSAKIGTTQLYFQCIANAYYINQEAPGKLVVSLLKGMV